MYTIHTSKVYCIHTYHFQSRRIATNEQMLVCVCASGVSYVPNYSVLLLRDGADNSGGTGQCQFGVLPFIY